MSVLHGQIQPLGGIHGIAAIEYADSTERLAAVGFVSDDVHKVAVDLDTQELHRLTDHDPITWKNISIEIAQTEGMVHKIGTDDFEAYPTARNQALAPTDEDDEDDGWVIGSMWFTTAGEIHICSKQDPHNAVWKQLNAPVGALAEFSTFAALWAGKGALAEGEVWHITPDADVLAERWGIKDSTNGLDDLLPHPYLHGMMPLNSATAEFVGAASAVAAVAGNGYNIGDMLFLAGMTAVTDPAFEVDGLTGGPGSGVASVVLAERGVGITKWAADDVATTTDGGGDDNCTLTVTLETAHEGRLIPRGSRHVVELTATELIGSWLPADLVPLGPVEVLIPVIASDPYRPLAFITRTQLLLSTSSDTSYIQVMRRQGDAANLLGFLTIRTPTYRWYAYKLVATAFSGTFMSRNGLNSDAFMKLEFFREASENYYSASITCGIWGDPASVLAATAAWDGSGVTLLNDPAEAFDFLVAGNSLTGGLSRFFVRYCSVRMTRGEV